MGLSYLEEVAVQLGDDASNFAQWRRCNFDAIEPLFVIDTAYLRPLKKTQREDKQQPFEHNSGGNRSECART